MKKISKCITYVLGVLFLLITIASAAQAASWSVTGSATLGSDSQEREETTTRTITITNTDNASAITNIAAAFTTTISGFSDSDFNITISGIPTQIDPGNSTTITIEGYVPKDFDSGDRKIGDMSFTADSGNDSLSRTVTLNMNAESNLEFEDVEIEINDKNKDVDDGDTFDVERGDDIILTINIENTHSDIEIEDVEVDVESDGDIDLNENEDVGDIGDGDEEEAEFSFDIPDDADDGRETVTIIIEGVDENGATHTAELEFDFDVEVEKYDLTISGISTLPSSVCAGDDMRLEIDIENTGLRDLSNAVLYIEIGDLDYTKKITDIEIDEGDDSTETVTVDIPDDAGSGTYFIDVEAFWKDSTSADTDLESGIFVVGDDCDGDAGGVDTGDEDTGDDSDFEIVTPTTTPTGQVFGVPAKKKSEFFESNAYLMLLIITNLVVIALVIAILTRAGKKEY